MIYNHETLEVPSICWRFLWPWNWIKVARYLWGRLSGTQNRHFGLSIGPLFFKQRLYRKCTAKSDCSTSECVRKWRSASSVLGWLHCIWDTCKKGTANIPQEPSWKNWVEFAAGCRCSMFFNQATAVTSPPTASGPPASIGCPLRGWPHHLWDWANAVNLKLAMVSTTHCWSNCRWLFGFALLSWRWNQRTTVELILATEASVGCGTPHITSPTIYYYLGLYHPS